MQICRSVVDCWLGIKKDCVFVFENCIKLALLALMMTKI